MPLLNNVKIPWKKTERNQVQIAMAKYFRVSTYTENSALNLTST